MKVVILAGGVGSRLQEETVIRPKPMVEIGGIPILIHIMRLYRRYGFTDFSIALGYKAEVIKDYFTNYVFHTNDITVTIGGEARRTCYMKEMQDPLYLCNVDLIDTGLTTMTGGRLKRMAPWVEDSTFMATYGDGLANVNMSELLEFHKSHGKLATVTAVLPPARYGSLDINEESGEVLKFVEKPHGADGWINGGFFVLEPQALDFVSDDSQSFEKEPMEQLAQAGELMAYPHHGFFQSMDTMKDKVYLEELWKTNAPPWIS